MKGVYWRPHKVSRLELLVVLITSLSGLLAVEHFRVREPQPNLEDRLAAARKMDAAMAELRKIRTEIGYPISRRIDPAASGVVGLLASTVTSNLGSLKSKRTTGNPNWAALIVEWLHELGIKEGDLVAIGPSGSFPGMNLAVYSALDVLGAKPVIVSSASSSQYGANIPELLWIDIEAKLHERGKLAFRSVAGSRGGIKDRAVGMTRAARKILDDSINRNGLRYLDVKSIKDSISQRMAVFDEFAKGREYKVYINIGGGTSSVGTSQGKKLFTPGINRKAPPGLEKIDSVMGRFLKRGVPLIHVTRIKNLSKRYGLPYNPKDAPALGVGTLYTTENYNRWLAGGFIVLILGLLTVIFRTPWGARTIGRFARTPQKPPEPMV